MPLPRYDLAILDNVPRAASGALVYVYTQPTSPVLTNTDGTLIDPTPWSPSMGGLATIYTDNAGSFPLSNPFPLDGNGNGWFYAVAEQYTIVINAGTLAGPDILVDQNLILTAGGGASFETNGSLNSVQTLLNLVQGSNITIAASGGNVTISGTAAAVSFKHNSIANSSQVLLNLIAGTGVTLSDLGGGAIQIDTTSAITLETNGVTNGSQSILNLKDGTHLHFSDDGIGGVTADVTWQQFKQNTVLLTAQDIVNFQNGANMQITNPALGTVQFDVVGITDAVQFATLVISSAQIKTLRATPLTILSGQGANTQIVPLRVSMEFVPVTTPYATVSTADLKVYVDTGKATVFIGDSTALIDQATKTYEFLSPTAAKFFTTDALSTNQPMKIANVSGAEYTAGDGTLNVIVWYVLETTV